MDTPGPKVPQIFSASAMGQNNHVSGTNIVQTLHSDKSHRRSMRGSPFPGHGASYPISQAGAGGSPTGSFAPRGFLDKVKRLWA